MGNKKVHSHWQRQYRERCGVRSGEEAFQLVLGESDLRIIADVPQGESVHGLAKAMLKTLEQLRADIQSWARLYPEFQKSLAPLDAPSKAPEIVRRMYDGASLAGVGPFAAVAGTVAHMLAEAHSAVIPNLIIENGGDVYMFSTKERVVALLAEPEPAQNDLVQLSAEQGGPSIPTLLGLRFEAKDFPLALCASSATIGHSLSLGRGELAVVRAVDGATADAVATALGNRLRGASSVQQALDFGQSIKGVEGLFVQCDAHMGIWGQMELVAVNNTSS